MNQSTPASFYEVSARAYPERLEEIEYEKEWTARRVSKGGQIRWGGSDVFIAHALGGERVGLQQKDDRYWQVWFSFYDVGIFDSQKRTIRRPPAQGVQREKTGGGPGV